MRICSIIGHKDAGKTTLLVALAREFHRQGKRVASIKHASHPALIDHQGSDTWRHFNEGCTERTLIASPDMRALFERTPDTVDPETLALTYMGGVDLVLVEGFKRHPHPKLEVWRRAVGQPLLAASDPHVIAVASDTPVDGLAVPRLDLNDAGAIAEFIVRHEAPKSRVA